jgi:pyrroloquinoline quinone (PQQ) biosynthesis protein C
MEFDLGELMRIAKKKQDLGEDALTNEELYMHAGFTAVATRLLLGRTEQQRADLKEGWEIFQSLSPEEQEKYNDWTPKQLQALWPFLKEQVDDESPPDAPSA